MTQEVVKRVGSDERLYSPSASRQALYAMLYLGRYVLFVFLIFVTGMWWWVSAILIAILIAGALIGFPRHYFGFSIVTSSDGLGYIPRKGAERITRWQDVSTYHFGGMWVDLLNDEGEIRYLFSRPLLVKGASELRREVVERCAGARRLSLLAYMKLVLRSGRQALRSARRSESSR